MFERIRLFGCGEQFDLGYQLHATNYKTRVLNIQDQMVVDYIRAFWAVVGFLWHSLILAKERGCGIHADSTR